MKGGHCQVLAVVGVVKAWQHARGSSEAESLGLQATRSYPYGGRGIAGEGGGREQRCGAMPDVIIVTIVKVGFALLLNVGFAFKWTLCAQ